MQKIANNSPLISVVIPCHNARNFLPSTLASLRAQSLTNWEAIIIDDGSEDNSAEIAWSATQTDPRIKLLYQSNWGVSQTRNRGVENARAHYVAFMDADDIWHPEYLEEILKFMSEKPERDVGFARVRFIDEHAVPTGAFSWSKLKDLTVADLMAGNPTTTCSNLVVRREAFLKSGGFKKGLNYAEDQLWLLQMHLSGALIEGLDRALVDYRTNNSGLSSDLEAMRRGWDTMVADLQQKFPDALEASIGPARARNLLYLSKRAWRTGKGVSAAFSYLKQSLTVHWPTLPSAVFHAIQSRI